MTLIDELFAANYNGIPFLVSNSTLKQARKTITHEYPGVKYRFIEDLGQNLRTFTVQGIITGEGYLSLRESLIIALNIKGKGILTHPFYGVLTVYVKDYTVSEDMTRIGECLFDMTFEEAAEGIFPITSFSNISAINDAVNAVIPLLGGAIETGITTNFKQNITPAAAKCETLSTNLSTNLNTTANYNTDNINNFNVLNKTFNDNRFYLIQSPADFGNSLTSLLDSYNNLAINPEDQYKINSSNYYFGQDDVYVYSVNTPKFDEQKKNDKLINSVINAQLLINLYANSTLITYRDNLQIDTIYDDLEEKYIYLLNNNTLDREITIKIEDIRKQINIFFNNLKVNISKVIDVSVSTEMPLTILLYNFYENFDNENEILSLNDIYDTGVIAGDIKMLSSNI